MRKTRIITFPHLKDLRTGEPLTLEVPDDDIARRHIDAAMAQGEVGGRLAAEDLKEIVKHLEKKPHLKLVE